MGVRLTGISTPVGGVSWEYTIVVQLSRQKSKLFIMN